MSQATVITMYLLPRVNIDLRPKLLELAPGTRLVSHDFDMGDSIDGTASLSGARLQTKQNGSARRAPRSASAPAASPPGSVLN